MKHIGNIEQFEANSSHLKVICTNGTAIFQLVNQSVLNYRIVPKNVADTTFSYAVETRTIENFPPVISQNNALEFSTNTYKVVIQKSQFAISIFTPNNEVILADDPTMAYLIDDSEITNFKVPQANQKFIGLGEKTGSLNKAGKYFVNWNTDQFAYHNGSDPLYASIPFFMGLHNNLAYGLYIDNSSQTEFNFGVSNNRYNSFKTSKGILSVYFFLGGPQPIPNILQQYVQLTGNAALPPKWALGFQQCRYSYYPDTDVVRIAETFREKDIPADVIYLDIHYMDQYKVFTWNPEGFPNPKETLNQLKALGFKTVVIVDPGVKIEEGYSLYNEGLENNYFVTYPDGKPYEGDVWPGTCHFPDFTKPEVRTWWAKQYARLTEPGVDGFWNDMNEPAVWGNKFPEVTQFNYDNHPTSYKEAHNVYGFQMARSTHQAAQELRPNERPFVLTRSGFAGIQRYAALWTGDNVSNEEHLFLGTRLITNLGLSGVWFNGNDVGGFIGESSGELFARWMQVGAFSPFFRAHSMINSRSAEPWTFGENNLEIARNYIKLRYALMPYYYSLVHEATQTGIPVQQALAMYEPFNELAYSGEYENQFLVGPNFMVVPCGISQRFTKMYLPEGRWFDFYSDSPVMGPSETIIEAPLYKLPIFIREGSILLKHQPGLTTQEIPEEIELHVYKSEANAVYTFNWYDDDGSTLNYTNGAYYSRSISYDSTQNSIALSAVKGSYSGNYKTIKVVLHGFSGTTQVEFEKSVLNSELKPYQFIEPLTNFDPWERGIDKSLVIQQTLQFSIPLNNNEQTIYLK